MNEPRSPQTAYKVLTGSEMATLQGGRFDGSADDRRDGFVHLSTADQLPGTLDRHFAGATDLHLAAVDLDTLGDAVRWEAARDGALFPHLHAPLPLTAVIAYGPLLRNDDGTIRLPVAG